MSHNGPEKLVCIHLHNDYSGSPYVLSQVIDTLLSNKYLPEIDLHVGSGSDGFLSRFESNTDTIPFGLACCRAAPTRNGNHARVRVARSSIVAIFAHKDEREQIEVPPFELQTKRRSAQRAQIRAQRHRWRWRRRGRPREHAQRVAFRAV